MSPVSGWLGRLLAEAQRRNVHRVALIYAVASGGVWGAAEVGVPALGLPDGVITAIVLATLIGFPMALALAWSFEIRLEEPGSAQPDRPVVGHRWGLVAVGAAAVVALTAGFVILGRPGGLSGAVLQEGAAIVLADFTSGGSNAGSDRDVALAVRRALRVDLEHSPHVSVVAIAVVQGARDRMELPAEAPLTAEAAREIAQRDGYAAVLEGDVARAGSGWLVTVRLTRAPGGETILSDRETLVDSTDVMPGVNRLSRRVRQAVGESAASLESSVPLPQLTTHSLEAIQAVAKAWRYYETGSGSSVPRQYFEDALAADSGFVQARVQLAGLASLRGNNAEAYRLLEGIYDQRDRLTPSERTDFLWVYHRVVTGDFEASSRAVRQFLEEWPAGLVYNQWMLVINAMSTGDFAEAESLLLELKREAGFLIPNHTHNLVFTWHMLGRDAQVDSVLALDPEDWGARVQVSLLREDWSGAEAASRPEEYNRFEVVAVPMFLALVRGQLEDFRHYASGLERHFESGGSPGQAALWGVLFAGMADLMLAGDTAAARRRLDEVERALPAGHASLTPNLALAMAELEALAGRPGRARAHLAHFDTLFDVHVRRPQARRRLVAESQALLEEGRARDAVGTLAQAEAVPGTPWTGMYFSFGKAYEALGQPDSAAVAYERALATRWIGDRHRRMRYTAVTHERLGQLYEALDRPADALRHYRKLVDDWQDADAILQPRVQAAQAAIERLGG